MKTTYPDKPTADKKMEKLVALVTFRPGRNEAPSVMCARFKWIVTDCKENGIGMDEDTFGIILMGAMRLDPTGESNVMSKTDHTYDLTKLLK